MTTESPERWLDKKGIAEHLSCSSRSIEVAIVDGLPYTEIFGRKKFKASEVEACVPFAFAPRNLN